MRAAGTSTALVVATLILAIVAAPPATAHAKLKASSPEEGSVVATLPKTVTLEFTDNVATPAFVKVTTSAGTVAVQGEPEIIGSTLRQAISGRAPAGKYTLVYRVISADGHPIDGTIAFRVRHSTELATDDVSPDGQSSGKMPDKKANATSNDGFQPWPVAGSAVLSALGLGIVLATARRWAPS